MATMAKGDLSLSTVNFHKLLNHKMTVLLITAALVVLVAWQVGSLVWRLLLAGAESGPPEITVPVTVKNTQPESLQNLLRYPLIQSASITATEGAGRIDAPETSLNLQLVGVMYSTDRNEARAIIVTPEDGARSFATRERVADNAEIYSIEPDRVILTHAGRQEALMLDPDQNPVSNQAGASGQGAGYPASGQAAVNSAGGNLASTGSRSAAAANTSKSVDDLMGEFSAEPVTENGILLGFRLKALRNPKILQELGIGPDDVITAVNGIPLNSPGRIMVLYDRLKKQREFEVTVDSGGNSRTIAVDLTE